MSYETFLMKIGYRRILSNDQMSNNRLFVVLTIVVVERFYRYQILALLNTGMIFQNLEPAFEVPAIASYLHSATPCF